MAGSKKNLNMRLAQEVPTMSVWVEPKLDQLEGLGLSVRLIE